ncbi:MAG: hypothetical protein FD149_847 [Rhodospirillaceae bacterium]|nr:MAG: hypothetical protein FD149_847 [Rhodospirillaceae bacterium]
MHIGPHFIVRNAFGRSPLVTALVLAVWLMGGKAHGQETTYMVQLMSLMVAVQTKTQTPLMVPVTPYLVVKQAGAIEPICTQAAYVRDLFITAFYSNPLPANKTGEPLLDAAMGSLLPLIRERIPRVDIPELMLVEGSRYLGMPVDDLRPGAFVVDCVQRQDKKQAKDKGKSGGH